MQCWTSEIDLFINLFYFVSLLSFSLNTCWLSCSHTTSNDVNVELNCNESYNRCAPSFSIGLFVYIVDHKKIQVISFNCIYVCKKHPVQSVYDLTSILHLSQMLQLFQFCYLFILSQQIQKRFNTIVTFQTQDGQCTVSFQCFTYCSCSIVSNIVFSSIIY